MRRTIFLGGCALSLLGVLPSVHAENKSRVDIGSRTEMFVDDWLIDSSRNTSLQLQTPVRREVVLVTDKPWEGIHSTYFTVFQDGALIRLYYRGAVPEGEDLSDKQVTCYAE